MGDLKHDAKACRRKQTSEQIRMGLGLLTVKEREEATAAQASRDQEVAKKAGKLANQGVPLFDVE